nr:nuclear transport factor 2 family protein [uncultured Pseudomonas sp.]
MAVNKAVDIVESFWREVWQAKDPQAAARFVAEDFVITSGGMDIVGRDAFIQWIGVFLSKIEDFEFSSIETFQNAEGTRVASRWKLAGKNQGLLVAARVTAPLKCSALRSGKFDRTGCWRITGLSVIRWKFIAI